MQLLPRILTETETTKSNEENKNKIILCASVISYVPQLILFDRFHQVENKILSLIVFINY